MITRDATGNHCHRRWRIEEAFKRPKERLKLETVSGLSQQAVIIGVATKILADDITSLTCAAGAEHANLGARSRKHHRSYAANFMQRVLSRLVALLGNRAASIIAALAMLDANSQRIVLGRSQPRKHHHAKPHPSGCCKELTFDCRGLALRRPPDGRGLCRKIGLNLGRIAAQSVI
jgi:hypothetical protein